MANRSSSVWLALANILLPVAIFTFAVGFFPYKPVLQGITDQISLEHAPERLNLGLLPEAQFDKVVFMVVDALRRYAPSKF
jgi:ethanolamine phosphate transferase 2 subunit G